MSSPEKQVENDENIPSQLTESKTPQQTRQGKRVPTESPYSWATPSHRKPLKQSRQPVFVADVNLEQTYVEQDTIMMFHRNATFNESCDFENTSQSEPGDDSVNESAQKSALFSTSQDSESHTEQSSELSGFGIVHEETEPADVEEKSFVEAESVNSEVGDMVEEKDEVMDNQMMESTDNLETDHSPKNSLCDSETEAPTALEVSGKIETNSLAAELDAVRVCNESGNVSENSVLTEMMNDLEEVNATSEQATVEECSEEAGSSSFNHENSNIALSDVSGNNHVEKVVENIIQHIDVENSLSNVSVVEEKGVTDTEQLESEPLPEQLGVVLPVNTDLGQMEAGILSTEDGEEVVDVQPDAIVADSLEEQLVDVVNASTVEMSNTEQQENVEVDSQSSSSDRVDLVSSESADSLQVEIDNTETEFDTDMTEDENPLCLQSEIESSDSMANLSSEEMDEPTTVTTDSSQITTAEETFEQNFVADVVDSTSSTALEICSETFDVEATSTQSACNRKSFDISAIKPEKDIDDSIESEARDQFDENRIMQTFTTPAKGQFSDSMVEFVMLENNFSLETENELRGQLARLRISVKEMNDQIESLTNENFELRNKIGAQAVTDDVNNQTSELTQTNVSLIEKISELEGIIGGLRQEHNQEIMENVTSKLINTTKELDSLRFDSRRNDSTIEIERAADLERLLEEMKSKNGCLEKLLSEKDSLMVELENSLAENQNELFLLKERLDSDTGFLTDTLQQKKQQISSLQKEVEDCRSRVTESETAIDELSSILKGNGDSVGENDEDVKSFEEKCKLVKSQVLCLQETSEELRKAGSENAGLVSETQNCVEDLKKELESVQELLRTTQEDFEKEKNTYMESNNSKEKSVEELAALIETLKTSVTQITETKEELDQKIVVVERDLSEALLAKQQQEEAYSKIFKQLEELETVIGSKNDELVELQKKEIASAERMDELKTVFETKERDLGEQINILKEEILLKENNFTKEVDELKSELLSKASLSEEVERLNVEIQSKSNALMEQSESLDKLRLLETELEESKKTSSSLEEEKSELFLKIAAFEENISQNVNEISQLKDVNSQLSEELDSLKEKHEKLVQNAEQSVAVLKLKEQELAETVPKLRKELTDVTVIVVELETKLVESMAKSSTLEEELTKVNEDSARKEKELEQQLSDCREKYSELEHQLSETNALISNINEEKESEKKLREGVQSEIEALNNQLEEKSKVIQQNEEEVQRLVSANEETKKLLLDSTEKFTEMEELFEKSRDENAQLKAELDEEAKKSIIIAQEFEVFRLGFEEMKADVRVKEEKLKEAESNLNESNEIKTELNTVKDQLAEAQNKISQFETMVQMGEMELNKLVQENSSLQTTIASVKTENESQSKTISELREETSRLLSAVNDNSKLEEKEKIIEALATEKNEIDRKLKSAYDDSQRMEDKLTTLTVDLTNEKSKTEKLLEEVSELRAEKDAIQSSQSTSATGDINALKDELNETKRKLAELEEKCSSQDNEVERLYKMCDEFDDIESELKQTIAEQDEEILSLKKKSGELPPDQAGGLLDVLKKGVKPLTPNTSVIQPITSAAMPVEDDDMEEGEGFSSAPSSPTKKGADNNVTMSTTMSSTMYKRIHSDQTIKSPTKDVNSSRCAQQ